MTEPSVRVAATGPSAHTVRLDGTWTLSALSGRLNDLSRALAELGADRRAAWDLTGIDLLDSSGALLIWRAWGRERPPSVALKPEHDAVLRRLARVPRALPPGRTLDFLEPVAFLGRQEFKLADNTIGFVALIGYVVLDLLHLVTHPRAIPWREVSASIYKAGARALPVTALVGFLIGIVVSYLSALTLRTYGAGLYIIDILGISIIRELGPLLAAILLAGRSGSAMTAQIGVMRVTEEIDAMIAMGLSPTLRLVLPKVLGMAIATPLVAVWVVGAALAGGWLAAYVLLGISFPYFFETLPSVVHPDNLWIATVKSVSFGIGIALAACHFGLRVRPNTESVSAGITASVVTSITLMILLDAVYAIIFRDVGFFTP
jgi:phospholipid/cholesterol/gamma-HCH transport system permease protein